MLKAAYCKYNLSFIIPAVTSRAVMHSKCTYFIKVWDSENPDCKGYGECALFKGLSCDDVPGYENMLHQVCARIDTIAGDDLMEYPSIRFGVETAVADLRSGGVMRPFPSQWSNGESEIPINGLVWMGTETEMNARVDEKLSRGFRCVKFKIGGIDFNQELSILERIRRSHPPEELEIRLDANGAFTSDNAMERLRRLSLLDIHSIEQPVKPGQCDVMSRICAESPIPICLDEELIGVNDPESQRLLLEMERPSYIILKPALCGGFSGAQGWIDLAVSLGIGWWMTSALESNIGLNAIAQWTSIKNVTMPQGLGTGALYANNIISPLYQTRDVLRYDPWVKWEIPDLSWIE